MCTGFHVAYLTCSFTIVDYEDKGESCTVLNAATFRAMALAAQSGFRKCFVSSAIEQLVVYPFSGC